uniref:Trichodiene oxygenase n=1 Tax=Talaromyces marneffei PM1 TaxID=1077442 RepID=A0A093VAB6_TALMA
MALLDLLDQMETPSWTVVLLGAFGLYILSLIITAIYNVCFHPLAKFPGPKIAVIGPWMGGTSGKLRRCTRNMVPVFASTHKNSRARRGYMNKYFSKRNMSSLEPLVQERLDRLCSRIDERLKTGETLNLDGCFSALTGDVITRLLYGNNFDYLGSPDFQFVVRNAFMGFSKMYHLARFIPLAVKILKLMPLPVIQLIAPPVAELQQLRAEIAENGYKKFHADKWDVEEKKSVIVSSLNDESIPPAERTVDRLVDEGTVILLAGTDTTSRSLAVTMYYLLSNPDCLAWMRHELETSLSFNKDHVYDLGQLEKLPYLIGVIHEGFRLSFGPVSRMPRISTQDSLQYNEWSIPPGATVSMSTMFMHLDENIYPNPTKYDPERWIRATKQGINLTKYLTAFSKGTRMCLGMNMAYAEFYDSGSDRVDV